MTSRRTPSPPNHRAEKPARTNNMPAVKSASTTVKVVMMTDTTLVSSLQAQLVAAQSALTTAQAQTVASAVTIASLGAQVSALQAQISALSTLKTYFVGAVTEVGGGVYVPPSYDNAQIFTEHVQPPRIIKQVTTVGGAFP